MSRVPAFLLNALRFNDPQRESLRNVTDSDWESVLSSWSNARLALFLRHDCGGDLPDWVRLRLDTYMSDTAVRFDKIKTAYSAVGTAMDAVNADHVVIKGFSLWPGYTDHPKFRPQGDIDLYCPAHSISRAQEVLVTLGYEADRGQEQLLTDHLPIMTPRTSWKPSRNLFDPETPVCFELHFCWWNELTMRFSPIGLDQFWARRIIRQLDEISFPGLDPIDNVAYTALNVLRDLFGGLPAVEQVYGLARFLDTHADDTCFWQRWRELHDDSLRRLEAIPFRLASDWFRCRLSGAVREEVECLPAIVQRWFRGFSSHGCFARFDQERDALWLHMSFLNSSRDKFHVLMHGLFSLPTRPLLASAVGGESQSTANRSEDRPSRLVNYLTQSFKDAKWIVRRGAVRVAKFPFFFWHGVRLHTVAANLSRGFWTFLAASFCFDLGMFIFAFLYNLYLLDRGFNERLIGAMTGATTVGNIACTIPAAIIINRFGLRKSLMVSLFLLPSLSAARVLFLSKPALLAFGFLAGMVTTIWVVALSPAITRVTTERNRSLAFSIAFAISIGNGVFANLIASRMPGWFAHLRPSVSSGQLKEMALVTACTIVALGLLPVSRLAFSEASEVKTPIYPRNPFFRRFFPAVALWSLVGGSLAPFANVYFSHHLRMPLERIGLVFSLANLFQVLALLAAPLLFRKVGLVTGIAGAQFGTAITLGVLAATSGVGLASITYVVYTGVLYMSEPGLFSLLMSRVAPAEQAGASALNLLVLFCAQAIAEAAAGASLTRFGYPRSISAMAGVALVSALFFYKVLGKDAVLPGPPSPVRLSSEVVVGEGADLQQN
jgi:putative nucleotidyltransferase-like protein/MFS transporter